MKKKQAAACPNHDVVKRGLCLACYNTLISRIRRGKTTLEEARAQGIIGPPGQRGRPVKNKGGRPLKKLKAAF